MKVTNEQFDQAMKAYFRNTATYETAVRAAIESLPEPLPRLRPLAEMPAEVPEGAVRLLVSSNQRPAEDVLGIDVLPPLPESPKPSLQDELVTALEELVNADDGLSPELDKARALIAKVKGGQP